MLSTPSLLCSLYRVLTRFHIFQYSIRIRLLSHQSSYFSFSCRYFTVRPLLRWVISLILALGYLPAQHVYLYNRLYPHSPLLNILCRISPGGSGHPVSSQVDLLVLSWSCCFQTSYTLSALPCASTTFWASDTSDLLPLRVQLLPCLKSEWSFIYYVPLTFQP